MVRQIIICIACLVSSWSVLAQQVMPEKESERQYISFSEAAPLVYAAAVARAKPMTTDPKASAEDSYKRALEHAKQFAMKNTAGEAGNDFSYLSFLPSLSGQKIHGETLEYTFGFSALTVVASREPGAFYYKLRRNYQSQSVGAAFSSAVKIYSPEFDFTFKSMPSLVNSVLSLKNLCTGTTTACAALQPYTLGRYKWFYRDASSPYMVACNDVSDCVQANLSYDFYNKTFTLRKQGYANQYYGEYNVNPSGLCADSTSFGFLQTLLPGLSCLFSLQYNFTANANDIVFRVTGDAESPYVRYISLNPIPISCPGATKYFQFATCDQRFADDVMTQRSLALLVDRMHFWGSQRYTYRGHQYTLITALDVATALGNKLVKVSTLGEQLTLPKPDLVDLPSTSPGTPGVVWQLGGDPAIQVPAMDSVSADSILWSIWSLFPSLAAWSPGSYAYSCPVFTPSVFGSTLRVDQHCQLLEGQRVALGVLSLVAWAATALLVVLRA